MKRFIVLLLGFVLLVCSGCTKQWSEETGYIYRDDIEPGDFAFLFDEWVYEPGNTDNEIGLELYNALRRDTIKPDDIFAMLGLPAHTIENYGMISYTYLIGDEFDSIAIKYMPDTDEIFDIEFGLESIKNKEDEENLLRLLSMGDRTIDREKYKMHKRFDISEDELSFIDESATSREIQQELGAPHSYIELRETYIESAPGNAFVYELENGNVLKAIYFRQGAILRAWVEDNDGNEIKLLIDKDVASFYEEE
jgi:hypothetical protein